MITCRTAQIAVLLTAALLATTAHADYEVPNAQWAAPASYYNNATGTDAALRMNLHNIIAITNPGVVKRTYGDARNWMPLLDPDPNNASNVRLLYNDQSISNVWDGSSWTREHQIPVSWLGMSDPTNTQADIRTDVFELRPINQSVNSTRSNIAYGTGPAVSSISGTAGKNSSGLWYAGNTDAGEVARAMFYMATCYYNGSATASINNLQIINGQPANGSFQIGDLHSLLVANYQHGVDNYERRYNQYAYSSTLNPTYYQGNRNPFIDHPEYVWAVFGTHTVSGKIVNNSQIQLASPTTNDTLGGTTKTIDLGRVILGNNFNNATVTLNKSGADPTTFDITTSGNALTVTNGNNLLAGVGHPFDFNAQSQNMTVTLNATTAGQKSGTVTVHNSDLTTAAAGQGSADHNDTVTLTGTVLNHSNASFSTSADSNSLTLNFGTLPLNSTPASRAFSIANFAANPALNAKLDFDDFLPTGSTAFTTDLALFTNAADTHTFNAFLNTNAPGTFNAVYTLHFSDENIPGATTNTPLTLTLTGTILAVPEPATLALFALALPLAATRRRRA